MHKKTIAMDNLHALDSIAKQLAADIPAGSWVYLQGDLGAGKTTFSKAFIAHKGCSERVTSPTYALMQDYETNSGVVIHCDLYRLGDPEELYEIGLLELAEERNAIVLVEWPSKGNRILPVADFIVALDIIDAQNGLRELTLSYQ